MSDQPRFLAKAGATRDYVGQPEHGLSEWNDDVTDKEGNKGGWVPEPEAVPEEWQRAETDRKWTIWSTARAENQLKNRSRNLGNRFLQTAVLMKKAGDDTERYLAAIEAVIRRHA